MDVPPREETAQPAELGLSSVHETWRGPRPVAVCLLVGRHQKEEKVGAETALALVGGNPWLLVHADTCAFNRRVYSQNQEPQEIEPCSCGLDKLRQEVSHEG
jgi:hypothetical protein